MAEPPDQPQSSVMAVPDQLNALAAPGDGDGDGLMTSDMEGADDGVPFGLLSWGQAGVYNAVDDRLVIAAVTDSVTGVVRPAKLTAGTGLQVQVAAGWLAIASADDGTSCVAGSRQTHLVDVPGGGGEQQQYHLWVDTNIDAGRWELRAVTQDDTIGRAGVSLGRITVPAGANLATQFSFAGLVPTLGRHSDVPVASRGTATSPTWVRVTPQFLIAPYQITGNRQFVLRASGTARTGTALWYPAWRGGGGQPRTPSLIINPRGIVAAGERFDWEAELAYQIRADLGGMRTKLTVTLTRIGAYNMEWQGNATAAAGHTITATRSQTAQYWNREWQEIFLEAAWNGTGAGQTINCNASTMETYEPWM